MSIPGATDMNGPGSPEHGPDVRLSQEGWGDQPGFESNDSGDYGGDFEVPGAHRAEEAPAEAQLDLFSEPAADRDPTPSLDTSFTYTAEAERFAGPDSVRTVLRGTKRATVSAFDDDEPKGDAPALRAPVTATIDVDLFEAERAESRANAADRAAKEADRAAKTLQDAADGRAGHVAQHDAFRRGARPKR